MSGKELNKQNIIDKDYYNSFRELLNRDGIINNYEFILKTKNDITKTCLLSAVYITIEEELHYIAMAHDISDLKSYQEEIQEVNTKLEEKIEQRTAQLNDTLEKLQLEIDSRIRVQEELEDSNYELKELNESMIIHSQKLLDLNERLSDSEAELLELNRELESRVNERTEELIEAYNKLENANQLKGIILNNLGHELRTPLNGAMGFLSMLLSEVSHNEHKEMLGLSYNSMKRLERTLNSLLYLTELESSKIKLNIEKVAVPTMLKYYFKTLFEMYEKNELEFEILIKDNKINALVDERLLYQVFYNVFDNAVKFTQNGTIRIVCTSEIKNNKKMALVKVIDSGIGNKKENIAKIFEPFRQESEGLSRISEGLGLGLSISQKMLHNMNGEIEIQSEYHTGTCVCIYLPSAEE